jgi:RimJ/RimL family protein N-acetyltransferase
MMNTLHHSEHRSTLRNDLFQGQLVRLAAADTKLMGKLYPRWGRNSEFKRMLDTSPAYLYSEKATREWFEREQDKEEPDYLLFLIRTLEDNKVIGDIGLDKPNHHGDAFVGIGIGETEYWNKGYGSDAMQIILRYAFQELNLHRVSLDVFEYNPRAIRSYQKAGFQIEGRYRQFLNREGHRWDMLFMGITIQEWLDLQAYESQERDRDL